MSFRGVFQNSRRCGPFYSRNGDARDLVFGSPGARRFSDCGCHAGHAAEHGHGGHPATRMETLHFRRESTWPGVVNDVDPVLQAGRNSLAQALPRAFCFQKQVTAADVIVMPRSPFLFPSSRSRYCRRPRRQSCGSARCKKRNALGRGRLAGVNVRGNADVPGALQRIPPAWRRSLSCSFPLLLPSKFQRIKMPPGLYRPSGAR